MPKILKAEQVYIDEDNIVTIKSTIDLPPIEREQAIVDDELPLEQTAEDLLASAKTEADLLLKRTSAESEKILKTAEKEAERIIAECKAKMEAESLLLYEEKRQEGYNKGIDDATDEAARIKNEAQDVLDTAHKDATDIKKAVEPEAVNLIINIIEKLIGDTVKINPAVVVSLIRKGFEGSTVSSQGGQIIVRVSGDDYDDVFAYKNDIEAMAGGLSEVEIVRDLSLSKTDCVIDTPFGGIDVSLTPQLESLKENLIFLMEHPNDA